MLFLAIRGPYGHPQIYRNRYSKACKWAGCMVQCLKDKPLNDKAHYFKKWSKTTGAKFLKLFVTILRPFGHPQTDTLRETKAHKLAECMAQYLSMKISR
jgi:hypothetical protein